MGGQGKDLCGKTLARDWSLAFAAKTWRLEQFAVIKTDLCLVPDLEEVTTLLTIECRAANSTGNNLSQTPAGMTWAGPSPFQIFSLLEGGEGAWKSYNALG